MLDIFNKSKLLTDEVVQNQMKTISPGNRHIYINIYKNLNINIDIYFDDQKSPHKELKWHYN